MTELIATAYVVLEPVYTPHGNLRGMKISRVTQRRPVNLINGEQCFPLNVIVPASVFKPLPGVSIKVPQAELVAPLVTVG